MADGESTTEQWRIGLQNDLRNIFESFMTRWDKRLDEMFGRKDHVIAGKPERAKMSGTGSEVQTNDFNPVVEEIVTVVDVENEAQVLMDTKTAVVEDPLQVKKPAKLEEDRGMQIWLGDEKSDSVERQPVIDKIHIHQISNKTSNVIDDYEKFDGISSMMFVDKNVMVDDPYGFRLLVMGRSNGVVLFEPILVLDLESHQLQIFTHVSELESSLSCLNVFVETYFAEVPVETYETLNSLKDVDPVNETKLDDVIKFSLVFVAQKVVGGIEAKVDISDQPMNMILPNVVGFKLLGKLGNGVTAIELNVNLPKKEIAQVTGDCELHIGTQFDGVYHVISWLVLFNWYDEKGTAHKSIGNFRKMLFSGLQIDVVPILNILVLPSEFCNCHQVDCFHSYVRRSVMVTGYGILGCGKEPVRVFKQMVMSSTTTLKLHKECGGSVDAILGYTLVVPENCEIACIGDGSFQVIGQDVLTMLRCGQETIIFLINDGGYTIEVEIYDGPYNKIKSCNHTGLLDTIHNGQENCWIAKVFCEKELIEAIEKTTELNHGKSGCKEIGFKKKRNRKGKPVESFLKALAAIQFVTTATFLGYSKKNNKNITFPIIENLQPKHTSKLTRAAGMIDQSLTLVVKMSPLLSILNLYGIASGKGNHADLSHCNNPSQVLDFIGAFELGNCWKGLNVMVVLIEVMKFKNACIAAKEKLSDDNQPTSTLSVNGKVALQKTQLGRLPISIMVFILEDKDVFKGRVFDMSQLAKSDDN